MPTFELEANGKSYEIEAPSQEAALSAFKGFKSGGPASARQPSTPQYDAMGSYVGGAEMMDAQASAPALSGQVSQASDIIKGIGGGLVRGAAGTVGLVTDTVPGWIKGGSDWAARKITGQTPEQQQAEQRSFAGSLPQIVRDAVGGVVNAGKTENLQHGIETVTGPAYEPTTRMGKVASRSAEFVPSALVGSPLASMVRNAVAFGVVPGALSEIGGQAFEGGAMETPARIVGALGGGIGGALAMRGTTAGNMIRRDLGDITPQQLDDAEQLFNRAAQAGQPISRAEAIQSVTNGSTKMGELQHTIEGMGGMRQFYSERPALNEAAGRRAFEGITPQATDPSQIGPTVGGVARQVMQESPEGQILADTLFRAGPRVSPEQAGATMQQELRGVYDRREGMRNALADQDYAAARNAPATIPQNGGHRVADVTRHYLDTPDIPIILDPTERAAARTNWLEANNPTSRIPIVGGRPTQFAQVDAGPVLTYLDNAIGEAKGAVRQGLQAARQALMRPDGTLDTAVQGLHNSRVAIGDLIDQAGRAGANGTVSQLIEARNVLDQTLERIPAYGQARQNFRSASEPLRAFDEGRVPGRIIERDQYNNRFTMDPERVPRAVQQGGPNAARDFNSVATPAAREAFEQNVVTQVLDKASREGADLSADSIRTALRQNEDVLRQYPGVRDRLESVAIARDGLARLETTPVGKLAQRDQTTQKAIAALFPENPLPGSQGEISEAIGALAQRNGWAARQLVRTHAESMFNEATSRLASGGPNQSGGAKFAAVLRGNSQQNANLEAAVRALPDGDQTWRGFNAFLDNLEAQQFRQATGSRTAFKTPGVEDLKKGGAANNVAQLVAAGGFNWPKKAQNAIEQWNVGRNIDDLSYLLTDPTAAATFRQIAEAPVGTPKALALTARLSMIGVNGRETGRPRVYIHTPR